jgi:hypothetical protein
MHKKTEMQPAETILLQSIQQYERILSFLQKMDTEVGTASPSTVLEFSKILQELQTIASQTDQILLTEISKQSMQTETMESLLRKREYVVKEILALNESIKAKAIGIKSLLGHEMETLRNGISALDGYRQQQHNQGRIVNSTS